MIQILKRQTIVATFLIVFLGLVQSSLAQLSGSRGGVYGTNHLNSPSFEKLNATAAQSAIMVEGKSVVSIKPSSIRIVLALTFEGLSSGECKAGMEERIAKLRPLWTQNGTR